MNTRPVGTGDDEDPTVINGRIRELLNTFDQRAYVGYTATPFANIFIFPDLETGVIRKGSLSPRLPGESSGAQQPCGTDQGVRPSRRIPTTTGIAWTPCRSYASSMIIYEHIPNSHRMRILAWTDCPGRSTRRCVRSS